VSIADADSALMPQQAGQSPQLLIRQESFIYHSGLFLRLAIAALPNGSYSQIPLSRYVMKMSPHAENSASCSLRHRRKAGCRNSAGVFASSPASNASAHGGHAHMKRLCCASAQALLNLERFLDHCQDSEGGPSKLRKYATVWGHSEELRHGNRGMRGDSLHN
jgi:hypothetical protein